MQGSAIPSLCASDIACRRGDRLLFRGFSIALSGGEALHVTGANGTGKTTLIRTLAGLMAPLAGTVETNGAIGLVDERLALDPDLPLGAALGFWERMDSCTDPTGALAVLELNELLDIPVRYLSTGQRKRAAFAALLNRGVPIWLLDEPLSGLDSAATAKIVSLIELHVGGGGIALVASHQPLGINGLGTLAIEDFAPSDTFEMENAP